MDNLALNRPATQSSTSAWSSNQNVTIDARLANNGNPSSPDVFHTARETNPWWQVDLEGSFLIERVVIHNRHEMAHRLKCFTLLRSIDGENWFEFFKEANSTAFELYGAEIRPDCLARFIRLRLDGTEVLHFRECEVFGRPAAPEVEWRLLQKDARVLAARHALPEGRNGHVIQLGGFYVFVDADNYAANVRHALEAGDYEARERQLALQWLRPGDRVLEIGTAIGTVSMTAAFVIGPGNVVTFDANPAMVADASANFRRNGLEDIKSNLGVLACRRRFQENTFIDFHVAREFWASRLYAKPGSKDIIKTVQVPMLCLEREIESHAANVLICDIEGGEVELLTGADLTGIRLIIMETHYWAAGEVATDAMIRNLTINGFSIHLGASRDQVLVLRRH